MSSSTLSRKLALPGLALWVAGLCAVAAAAATGQGQLAAIEQQMKAENFAQAETALSAMIVRTPHAGPEAYRLLGLARSKLEQNGPAMQACDQGLMLYPASGPLAQLYVFLLQSLSPAERLAQLKEISGRIPASPLLAKALSEELLAADPENTQAFGLLASVVKRLPQDPEAHFFYGEAACFNKQDALCVRELTQAHDLAPKNDYANMQLYTMIAVAEDRLKEPVRAAAAFARSMKANERLKTPSPYAALKYVTFLTAQGKDKEAVPVIDQMLTWDASYGPAHFERAKILVKQGAAEEAVKEAELALSDRRATPTDQRTYHAFLAKTEFALGRESDARLHQEWIEANQPAGP